ncbi:phosphopentomutase [Candidatus Mycoplasma mahonii]|uniref:phosphopentomutase n=1 Tax=Candidatus Mycoplasma mahonii TaxID=3004105 RepID=UPI0026EFDEDF|nr:phosphopentomutase [Candidatus Mycoplasma mahonii]WKX02562.1 phosphopentomutase [Candidatus Mycoplasma mahonii]
MKKQNRVIMIVTDSLGIGGDKEAAKYRDKGANTFLHISQTNLLEIPTWKKLGIDSIAKLTGFNKAVNQTAYMARMQEISNAKDTLAGHWEMMGIKTETPFPVFTDTGFPDDMIKVLEKAFDGRKIVANASYSGTVVLNKFANQEINDNKIIVYTSSDSVLQICGHEEHMGLDKLYEYSQKARAICDSNPKWRVGRIIARPYISENGSWKRTSNRHDYAVTPPKITILDELSKKGTKVIGVGKINDIFVGQGINESHRSTSDDNGMDITIDLVTKDTKNEFIFINLVQFDSDYGHRRDPEGYAKNINRFDIKLAKLINAMKEDDLLIITSDHGNDPTFPGSNHTREQVPVTIFSKSFEAKPKSLKEFKGFGTVGNIVARVFGIDNVDTGEDRFDEIK